MGPRITITRSPFLKRVPVTTSSSVDTMILRDSMVVSAMAHGPLSAADKPHRSGGFQYFDVLVGIQVGADEHIAGKKGYPDHFMTVPAGGFSP